MPSSKDVMLLAVDDAVVTLGSQFREVALGLLITGLSPNASSYAWYFLAGSIPGLVLARAYAWASQRFEARDVMMATYAVRLILVLGLWRVTNFWAAMGLLLGISAGSGLYAAAQAHYVGIPGDFVGTRQVVMRLRQSQSVMLLAAPLMAGLVLIASGYRTGFLVSLGAYLVALMAVSQLTPLSHTNRRVPYERIAWRPDAPAVAMFALSFLIWQANTLAIGYTFHILHRQAFGYGLTLAAWGGSGLLASVLLSRIRLRPLRWVPPLFFTLGISWLILSHGVSFPVFVVIGGIEGLATWLIQDLVVAVILSQAPEGQVGHARARLGAFDEMGSIVGTLTILLVPATWLILPMYVVLGMAGLVAAGAWWYGLIRHKRPRQPSQRVSETKRG